MIYFISISIFLFSNSFNVLGSRMQQWWMYIDLWSHNQHKSGGGGESAPIIHGNQFNVFPPEKKLNSSCVSICVEQCSRCDGIGRVSTCFFDFSGEKNFGDCPFGVRGVHESESRYSMCTHRFTRSGCRWTSHYCRRMSWMTRGCRTPLRALLFVGSFFGCGTFLCVLQTQFD